MQYDALFKDVASVLVEKCVNPETNRPYTNTMLERALRDAHFAVDPKRSAKQQALEVRQPVGPQQLGWQRIQQEKCQRFGPEWQMHAPHP